MPETRFHGRGGQGAVVASRLLAEAAFQEGRFVQSFPAFGLERRGAPVMAFTRIQDSPINDHSQIYRPDSVVVLDATLLKIVNVSEGLKPGGILLINTDLAPEHFSDLSAGGAAVYTVNASGIAAANGLGTRMAPIVNTAILGGFARASGFVSLESVFSAIRSVVKIAPEKNIEACRQSFDSVAGPAALVS